MTLFTNNTHSLTHSLSTVVLAVNNDFDRFLIGKWTTESCGKVYTQLDIYGPQQKKNTKMRVYSEKI